MTAVVAHRGASTDAPENTLAAMDLAWRQGADAVEMDLRMSRDGRLVVIHDADFGRVAGSVREVSSLDAADLKKIDVGRWKGAQWTGERVPLLEEVLAAVPDAGRVMLELKEGPPMLPELQRCLGRAGLDASRVCIIAFDRSLLVESKKRLPEVEHAWVIDRPAASSFDGLVDDALRSGLDALDLEATWPLDQVRVSRAHEAGLKVFVWTVDDIESARHLAAAGVDGITTNSPALLHRALRHSP